MQVFFSTAAPFAVEERLGLRFWNRTRPTSERLSVSAAARVNVLFRSTAQKRYYLTILRKETLKNCC